MTQILPPITFASDEERRMWSKMEAASSDIVKCLDAAIRLRTASGKVKAQRQQAIKALREAAFHAVASVSFAEHERPQQRSTANGEDRTNAH